MRFESIDVNIAIVFEEDGQSIADEYLINKNGSLEESPEDDIYQITLWLAGDRNYYDLIKI